jgi:hypothetical protein
VGVANEPLKIVFEYNGWAFTIPFTLTDNDTPLKFFKRELGFVPRFKLRSDLSQYIENDSHINPPPFQRKQPY